MKNICYPTQGTCSKLINVSIDDDNKIHDVSFVGGCMGNTCGVSRLVEGMDADEVIARLRGITCGNKLTSCPDQLSLAIEALKNSK